jgi:hypothetical protein
MIRNDIFISKLGFNFVGRAIDSVVICVTSGMQPLVLKVRASKAIYLMSGGVVGATNATFLNNYNSIWFDPYGYTIKPNPINASQLPHDCIVWYHQKIFSN